MNAQERVLFIDKELKGLWLQWEPTEAEVRLWLGVLTGYDYPLARTALQRAFCEQGGNYSRPKPHGFLAQAKALSPRSAGAPHAPTADLCTDTFIECLEPPVGKPHLAGVRKPVLAADVSKRDDPDHVWACAESLCRRFQQLYGGHWIVVRTPLPAPDARRGGPARDEAYHRILSGPDTPGQRWLRRLLGARADAAGPAADAPDVASESTRRAAAVPTCTADAVPLGDALPHAWVTARAP